MNGDDVTVVDPPLSERAPKEALAKVVWMKETSLPDVRETRPPSQEQREVLESGLDGGDGREGDGRKEEVREE